MKFSLNWLKDYLTFKESAPTIAQTFDLKSFEVAEIKRTGEDDILDIDILPNRMADASSHFGLARELALIFARPLKLNLFNTKNYKFPEIKSNARQYLKVSIKNKKACPLYSARVIFDVKIGPSPDFIKRRLEKLGLKSINNIVDITNYVMLELGQPLHAFDFDKLESKTKKKEVVVRFAKKNELFRPIDGAPVKLTTNDLIIADSKKPIALAGIKGGENTMVDLKTEKIIIESANFNQENIYLSSKHWKMATDASMRFGAGLDPALAQIALERAAYLIWRYAGGRVLKSQVVGGKIFKNYKKIILNPDKLRNLLGVNIKNNEIKKILLRLGCGVSNFKADFIIAPPLVRLDLNSPEDLAEEIIRIYGLNRIQGTLPVLNLTAKENELDEFKETLRDYLKDFTFNETYNYSFISKRLAEFFSNNLRNLLEIKNPPSANFQYFRPSLVFGLFKDLQVSQSYQNNLKFFEIGTVAQLEDGTVRESLKFAGIVYKDEPNKELFWEIKGYLSSIFEELGLADVGWEELFFASFHFENGAKILVDEEEIGYIATSGEQVKDFFDLKHNAALFELDLTRLFERVETDREFEPLAKFPAVIYDISFLVDIRIRIAEILSVMNNAGAKYIEDIDLFDIYNEASNDRQSISFHIIFRAPDHTLSEAEAKKEFEKIKKAVETKLGATVR